MALLYDATLTPTKLELLAEWLPKQAWYEGDGAPERVAAFRFDDPEGEVGVETLLIRAGSGPLLQVPVTYRGAPLAGAESSLIGTTQHSVLGPRWVYDGPGDPVYLQTLAETVLTGGTQAEQWIDEGKGLIQRDPLATVLGGGTPGGNVPEISELDIQIVRVPIAAAATDSTLIGNWAGAEGMLLATVLRR
jgi:hypothetical protein